MLMELVDLPGRAAKVEAWLYLEKKTYRARTARLASAIRWMRLATGSDVETERGRGCLTLFFQASLTDDSVRSAFDSRPKRRRTQANT